MVHFSEWARDWFGALKGRDIREIDSWPGFSSLAAGDARAEAFVKDADDFLAELEEFSARYPPQSTRVS